VRAYPDNQAVLDQAERMLARFERRADLRRHRAALADTGIAGTAIHYVFFWFYDKLGFRPVDRRALLRIREERMRLRLNPRERSSPGTLHKLSAEYVFLDTARPRRDVLGQVSLANIGLHVSHLLARRFGAERERGIQTCAQEAARRLGVHTLDKWSSGERLAWERWSPLILCLNAVEHWPIQDCRALVRVVRAKGGRRESDFVRLFDSHRRLRRAMLRLAATEP
jgi:hypothetical protein